MLRRGGPPPDHPEFSKPYVSIAYQYAQWLADEANKAFVGRWMRLAGRRFLADLKRIGDKEAPFIFSPWHACDPCDFIEKLPHVEGRWKNSAGKEQAEIELHASDVFFLVQLFGFRNPDGTRRFTTAVKAVGRKNAKSTIAAGIGLYCETCEGEVGPQVISAATTGSQARIVFNIARKMVEATPDLRDQFALSPFANSIACYSNGGFFKPINAKASTQDGLNPSAAIVDEIHAHKDHDLVNVLQSAAGARANPLFLFTTTEGYETPGPWPELRHFMQQVLLGVLPADHFLCVYYAVDAECKEEGIVEDDDFDENAWYKANPLLEVNPILLRELHKEAIEAKARPGKLAEFRTKRLNRPSSVAEGWISFPHWQRCSGPVDLDLLLQHPCHGALDLANIRDLVSFRLTWLVAGVLYTWGRRWVPERAVHDRTVRGTVPYAGWVAAGYLEQMPGEVINHDIIIEALVAAKHRFLLQKVAYDPWNAAQLVQKAKAAGVRMQPFIQGPKSYHPAMQFFEEQYVSGRFRHGGDPVLTWNASNLVARTDVNMNNAPDKRKSKEKIDDMVALLMSSGLWVEEKPKQPALIVIG